MYRSDAAPFDGILVTAFRGRVFGINRTNGAIVWAHETGGQSEIEIAIIDSTVIAVESRSLTFLDYATGRVYKQVALAGEYPWRPVMLIDKGHIYIARSGELTCYSASGDTLWHQPFTGQGFGELALALPGQARQADSRGNK